jgi:hypothetical protein
VRDPDNPVLLDTASALADGNSFPFGTWSGNSLLRGHYLYRHVPQNTETQIQVHDVSIPTDILTVGNGALGATQPTCPGGISPDCEEYVFDMDMKEDVLVMATGHGMNAQETPNYLFTMNVDDRHGLGSAAVAKLGASGIGYRSALNIDIDGQYAFVSTTDGASNISYVCVVDVDNPLSPTEEACTNVKATNGSTNLGRIFSLNVANGFVIVDSDSDVDVFDATDPTNLVATAVRHLDVPAGAFVGPPYVSGPGLFGVLGNSSLLPLGSLVGIDLSLAPDGIPVMDLLGSYLDAEIASGAPLAIVGDMAVLGDGNAGAVSFVKLQ